MTQPDVVDDVSVGDPGGVRNYLGRRPKEDVMSQVIGYRRPTSIDEAVELLARPGLSAKVLAGGTAPRPGNDAIEVIDLQALGLDGVAAGVDRLSIGSMTRLQDLVEHPLAPSEIRELARRELPSSLRSLATIGGTIGAGDWESELLAGLLACDTIVSLRSALGTFDCPLPQVLADRSTLLNRRIITGITVAVEGRCASARTGRTPADVPIVAVVGRRLGDGRIRLAITGVAETPVLVDDPSRLSPPGDFRGSSAYRRSLAATLASRVRAELGS